MTHTQQIIKDAIDEGWQFTVTDEVAIVDGFPHNLDSIFLDPSFWQAVGKTRGWRDFEIIKEEGPIWNPKEVGREEVCEWKQNRNQFIDYLDEGDDYETALSKLI